MAKESVKIVKIDTQPAQKSVKDLRNELKELRSTLLNTEEGTEEYNNAMKQAADIQHTLREQMEEVNNSALDAGQIFGNMTSAIGGVVAGFQAATAVMNLFGVENEDVIKSLKTMQNLMSITQALPALEKGRKAFLRLAGTIRTNVVALQGFSKALIATGIGAIVVAIGLLIANWDKLTAAIKGNNEELERQKNLDVEGRIKSENDELQRQINLQTQLIRLRGGNDVQVAISNYNLYKQALDNANNALEEQQKVVDDLQKEYDNTSYAIQNWGKKGRQKDALEEANKNLDLLKDNAKKAREEFEKADKALQDAKIIQGVKDRIDVEKEENQQLQKLIDKYTTLKEKLNELASLTKEDWGFGNLTNVLRQLTPQEQEVERLKREAKRYADILMQVYNEFVDTESGEISGAITEVSGITFEMLEDTIRQFEFLYGTDFLHYAGFEKQGVLFTQLFRKQAKERESIHEDSLKKQVADTETAYNIQLALLQQQLDEEVLTQEEYDEKKREITEQYVKDYIEQIKKILQTETGLTQETILNLNNAINTARDLLKKPTESGETIGDGITDAINASALALNEFSDNPAWSTVLKNLAIISANWDEIHKKIKDGGKEAFTAYAQIAAAGLGAIGAMLTGLANEQDTSNKKGFEAQKNYQYGATLVNMLAGIASAWSSSMQLPFPVNVAVGATLSTMMTALGIAQMVKISKTKFGDKSGAAASANASPNTSAINSIIAPVQFTSDVRGASIEGAIKDTKVYVVESDITDTQNKVHVAESESKY